VRRRYFVWCYCSAVPVRTGIRRMITSWSEMACIASAFEGGAFDGSAFDGTLGWDDLLRVCRTVRCRARHALRLTLRVRQIESTPLVTSLCVIVSFEGNDITIWWWCFYDAVILVPVEGRWQFCGSDGTCILVWAMWADHKMSSPCIITLA